MKTRSEVRTTSALEFFTGRAEEQKILGLGMRSEAGVGAWVVTAIHVAPVESTPIGDRRPRSPFRSSDLSVNNLRARLVDTARCLGREIRFSPTRGGPKALMVFLC